MHHEQMLCIITLQHLEVIHSGVNLFSNLEMKTVDLISLLSIQNEGCQYFTIFYRSKNNQKSKRYDLSS